MPPALTSRAIAGCAAFGIAGVGGAVAEEWYELDPSLYDDGVEERVYEDIDLPDERRGLPEIRWDLADGGFVQIYGHINWGLLNYDDGRETETFFPIDNANSPSRIGLRIYRPLEEGGDVGFRLELGYSPFSTFFADQLSDNIDYDLDRDNVRWLEVAFRNEDWGNFSFGQGSMATDGITLIDFSGTNVVAYSSPGDSAAGQFLRFTDASLPIESAPRIRNAFVGLNGPRRTRIRYDTPNFNGFVASAAYGRQIMTETSSLRDDDLYDVALTYGSTVGDFRVGAGAGYFWDRDDREIFSGSASILHEPTGLNASVAGGQLDTGSRTADYIYGKLGYRRDFLDIGDSAVSVDYYAGEDIAVDGSDSDSWSLTYVQFIDRANTELWLTYRVFDYDEPDRSFEEANAVYGGFRFRF